MKKKLHQRKRLKTWNQISPEQMEKVLAMSPQSFTPMKGSGFVSFAPETNSEIGTMMSEEGECEIRMWREIGKDVFVHIQTISVHGARALFTSLNESLKQYDAKKAKAD